MAESSIKTNGVIRRQSTKLDENKSLEAQEKLEKAEKKTKRRWKNGWKKPNLFKAAHIFTQSAVLFCQTNDQTKAQDCLLQAYECYKQKRSWYEAAKTLEQVIKIAEDTKQSNIDELALKTANAYDAAGQPDLAAQLLEKVANIIKESNPISTEVLLEKAIEITETENRPIQAAFFVSKIIQIKLQNGQIDQCIEDLKKMVKLYLEAPHKASAARSVFSLVLVLVSLERIQEGEKIIREYGGQCSDEQNHLMNQLIKGCQNSNEEMVQKSLKNSLFPCLRCDYKIVFETIEEIYMPNIGNLEDNNELGRKESKAVSIQTSVENVKKSADENQTSKKPSLVRRSTVGAFEPSELEKSRLENLHPATMAPVHMDVTGFDAVEPRFSGMTIDQWREFKKHHLEKCETIGEFDCETE